MAGFEVSTNGRFCPVHRGNKGAPVFGPIKNDMPRTLDLGAETITLLREHKRHQAEMKMANRTIYRAHGLVFTKEGVSATGGRTFLVVAPGQQHRGARIGAHHQSREGETDFVSRPALHVGSAAAKGGSGTARGAAAARAQADQDDSWDLRARVAVNAAGCGKKLAALLHG
jgi:hypothetical protein